MTTTAKLKKGYNARLNNELRFLRQERTFLFQFLPEKIKMGAKARIER